MSVCMLNLFKDSDSSRLPSLRLVALIPLALWHCCTLRMANYTRSEFLKNKFSVSLLMTIKLFPSRPKHNARHLKNFHCLLNSLPTLCLTVYACVSVCVADECNSAFCVEMNDTPHKRQKPFA